MPIDAIDAGAGPPLVLLHGIGSNAKSWHRQVAGLSNTFRVIVWNAPGYGASSDPPPVPPSMRFYADALCELLSQLGVGRANLVGHSLGGVIAQEFYRAYPESVSSLILSDTTTGGGSGTRLDERLRMIRTMTPARLAQERAPKLLSKYASEDLIGEAVSIMSEVRRPGYEFAAIALAEADTKDVLEHLEVPTLLIWGAEDEITPLWREVPRGANLEVIERAGHLCYAEQATQFNSLIRNFI